MWWIGNFTNNVSSDPNATPLVPTLLEFHVTCGAELIDKLVGTVPAQVPTPLQILYTHLPIAGAGEQLGQHAPGRPG
jgi:hypothetical protein